MCSWKVALKVGHESCGVLFMVAMFTLGMLCCGLSLTAGKNEKIQRHRWWETRRTSSSSDLQLCLVSALRRPQYCMGSVAIWAFVSNTVLQGPDC